MKLAQRDDEREYQLLTYINKQTAYNKKKLAFQPNSPAYKFYEQKAQKYAAKEQAFREDLDYQQRIYQFKKDLYESQKNEAIHSDLPARENQKQIEFCEKKQQTYLHKMKAKVPVQKKIILDSITDL